MTIIPAPIIVFPAASNPKGENAMIRYTMLILLCFLILLTACCLYRTSTPRKIRSYPCGKNLKLVLTCRQEFVELAFQDRYELHLEKEEVREMRLITGNIAVLPRVKRYLDRIRVRDYAPGKAKTLFSIHYVLPSRFTAEEFEAIDACYASHRDRMPEISRKVEMLVYGDPKSFYEIYRCPGRFYIRTEIDGNLTITDDPSYESLTQIPEKRHFNHVGFFNDRNELYLRKGKIVSGILTGFFGKPVRKVRFRAEGGREGYTGEVETLWVDLLYSEQKEGVNEAYLLSSRDESGRRLDEVFRYRK